MFHLCSVILGRQGKWVHTSVNVLLFKRTFFTGSPSCLQSKPLLLRLLYRLDDFLTQAYYRDGTLAPLVIMLKTSLTLCAFLALLTGPPVLDCFLLHSEADVDHLSVHALQLNLKRVLVQADPLVLSDTVHDAVVKSLAAICELIKTAATIRSTRIVRFLHEVCSCDADAVWTFTFTNGSSQAPAPNFMIAEMHDAS